MLAKDWLFVKKLHSMMHQQFQQKEEYFYFQIEQKRKTEVKLESSEI